MTKAELLKAIEPFDDDQYVFVNLHSDNYPSGSQVIIQAVRACEPWHPGPKPLIGLFVSATNRQLPV